MKITLGFVVLMMCASLDVKSQYALGSLSLAEDVTVWFDKQLGIANTPLVFGTYKKIYVSRNTHPFYKDRIAVKGSLKYRNETFQGVDLMYNSYEDDLIIVHPTLFKLKGEPICLDKGSVEWFELGGSHFRNYFDQESRNGFYEILTENDAFSFVSKRVKTKDTNSSTMTVEFSTFNEYFLFFENHTYSVKRKGHFIQAFPQFKKEIKSYVQKNELNVRPKSELDMTELAEYCGQLISRN